MKRTSKSAIAAFLVTTLVAAAPAQASTVLPAVQQGFWGSLVTAIRAAISPCFRAAISPCYRTPTQG